MLSIIIGSQHYIMIIQNLASTLLMAVTGVYMNVRLDNMFKHVAWNILTIQMENSRKVFSTNICKEVSKESRFELNLYLRIVIQHEDSC